MAVTDPTTVAPRRHASRVAAAVAAVCVGSLIAACSSASSGDTTSSASTSAASTQTIGSNSSTGTASTAVPSAVSQAVATFSKSPDFGLTPLSSAPKPGGSIVYIYQTSVPSDVANSEAVMAAAKAIGWKGTQIAFDSTPAGLQQAMTQAIADKPTGILFTGFSPSALGTTLAQADKASIAVVDSNQLADATGMEQNGLAGVAFGSKWTSQMAQLSADWVIKNSNGEGNVLIINATSGLPGNAAQDEAYAQEIKTQCPGCSSKELVVQLSDIGSKAPGLEVAALEADPSINYVWCGFGLLCQGLDAALKAAGLQDKVKVTSLFPLDSTITAIHDGTEAMSFVITQQVWGWTMVDTLLRALETNGPVTTNYVPAQFITSANAPSGGTLTIPPDYEQQFLTAWKVQS